MYNFIFLIIFFLVCVPAIAENNKNILTIQCAVTTLNVTQNLVAEFRDKHPDIDVVISSDINDVGMNPDKLNENYVYIGINREDNNENAEVHHIYAEIIAFVVNKNNPISSISIDQITLLLKGGSGVLNWMDFAQNLTGVINVHGPLVVSEFSRHIMSEHVKGLISGYREHEKLSSIIEAVSHDPLSIGFIPLGFHDEEKVKLLNISGVSPHNVIFNNNDKVENYPLMRRISIFLNKNVDKFEAATSSQIFKDFILSQDGHDVIKKSGFKPWNP